MKALLKAEEAAINTVQGILGKLGFKIAKLPVFPLESKEDQAIYAFVRPYTMTTQTRVFALIESIRYVEREQIPGAIVECGVWRGGSMMAAIKALTALGVTNREIYLFDTFEGMTAPSKEDDGFAQHLFHKHREKDGGTTLARCGLDEVRDNVARCAYPMERIHFVRGPVEETLPGQAPDSIALLRLDTDWYASTKHELEHLFPRLQPGGTLIIDDYGAYDGARKAVDEYFSAERPPRFFLHRIDESGRLVMKH